MTNIQELRCCTDLQTRKLMWVAVKNGEQLGVFDAVSIAASFRDRYAFDAK